MAREPEELRHLAMKRIIAAALAITGIACLTYTGYRVWDPFPGSRQHAMATRLHKQRAHPSPSDVATAALAPEVIHAVTGQPFAFIRIPALGRHWAFTIVEGTGEAELATGPGHVTGTALPNRPGNFAVAAHVLTAGNAFLQLKTLKRGDLVYVSTHHRRYVYEVYAKARVRDTDVKVLDPQPRRPRVITLITCDPAVLYATPWRIIVWGTLIGTTPR